MVALAHYYCEWAIQFIESGNYNRARQLLRAALEQDRGCVRASLLLADVDRQTGNYDRAIKQLRNIRNQQPAFISEIIEPIKHCFQQKSDRKAYREFLQESLESYPKSIAVVLALGEEIEEANGSIEAANFLASQLQDKPSMRALRRYLELEIMDTDKSSPIYHNYSTIENTLEKLQETKPHYRCTQCGFAGKHIHWQCPSCKQWGKVFPIRGVEGD